LSRILVGAPKLYLLVGIDLNNLKNYQI